jgi:hypothetical protein
MATLEPETLVWKLAGRVLLAATERHIFEISDLPILFEQLAVQLQQFPSPPEIYRPVRDEPVMDHGARVRIVTGLSGAGKTAWAAQAASYLGNECAYYDVGDIPGPAIAASLVRELAAHWASSSADGLRKVLLPGATGMEALRALDTFIGVHAFRAFVVLDNAHRVSAADLRMLFDATRHLRFILLGQPSTSLSELEAMVGVEQETLHGWEMDQVAAEAKACGARGSVSDLGRLLALTGGLPLYVRSAAELSARHYHGDIGAMCSAVEQQTHIAETAQELILSRSFDTLPPTIRDCVAALSLSAVPLTTSEALQLVGAVFGVDAPELAAAIRQLKISGVVRLYAGQRLQVHDAFRVVGVRRYSQLPLEQERAGREALKELLIESLDEPGSHSRFPLLIRTLVELGDLKSLIDIATEEWFHELGVSSGIWVALEAGAANPSIEPKQRFYALDGLVFNSLRAGSRKQALLQLEAMKGLLAAHDLGMHEQLVYNLKRMTFEASTGNRTAALDAMSKVQALALEIPEHQRIIRYNIAHAHYKLRNFGEAERLASAVAYEYYELFGLTPTDVIGLTSRALAA